MDFILYLIVMVVLDLGPVVLVATVVSVIGLNQQYPSISSMSPRKIEKNVIASEAKTVDLDLLLSVGI